MGRDETIIREYIQMQEFEDKRVWTNSGFGFVDAYPIRSSSRDRQGPRAVGDPVHVSKHFVREPGDPMFDLEWQPDPYRQL